MPLGMAGLSSNPKAASLKTAVCPVHQSISSVACGAAKYIASVNEACALSIVFTSTPHLVLRVDHPSPDNRQTSDNAPTDRFADLTIQSLLGGASVTNGLEFQPAWLNEPSEPGSSRMQSTKRRI